MSTKTKELRDGVNRVTSPHGGHLMTNTTAEGEKWYYGAVLTRYGYVQVHAEPTFTSISVVHYGCVVYRHIRRAYTRRGLVTLANRFAEEICG
jgi:hypothetical protein